MQAPVLLLQQRKSTASPFPAPIAERAADRCRAYTVPFDSDIEDGRALLAAARGSQNKGELTDGKYFDICFLRSTCGSLTAPSLLTASLWAHRLVRALLSAPSSSPPIPRLEAWRACVCLLVWKSKNNWMASAGKRYACVPPGSSSTNSCGLRLAVRTCPRTIAP